MTPSDFETSSSQGVKDVISLPFGLIGSPHLTKFSLEASADELPFQRLISIGEGAVEIVVVEPGSVVEAYPLEISDEDGEMLGLKDGSDALVLTVVAIHSMDPLYVTTNLLAPIVINRKTLLGKQVFVPQMEYSMTHVLSDLREPASGGGAV